MKVLLIEDSKTLQVIHSKFLTEYGATVITAECGEEAVQLLEFHDVDLVICDIDMPGLDGLETVPIIREFFNDKWVPIIFITGRDTPEDFVKGLDAGADDYLIKPINKGVLHAKLKVMQRFITMQEEKNHFENNSKVLSKLDSVTQFYTRDHFMELAELEWCFLERQSLSMSCLLVSIDDFDGIKETANIEIVLSTVIQVTKEIRSNAQRSTDIVGQWRDGCYAIMLPDTSKSGAEVIANHILNAINKLAIEHPASPNAQSLSISIGGGTCSRLQKFSLQGTLALAEHALLVAMDKPFPQAVEILKFTSMKDTVSTSYNRNVVSA